MFPLHLLIALAEEKEGIVRPVLEKCGVQPDAIVAEATPHAAHPAQDRRHAARHVSLAAAQPSPRARLRRGQPLQRRIRLHRAPAAGHRRGAQRPRRPTAGPRRRHPRRHPESPGLGARHAARHRSESGDQIPGAGALRARPDRIRPPGQARPGDRPRRRDPPRDAGAQPPHQEQPGADRRARRRQDRHRRRPGAAHRARRRARSAQEQEAWWPSTSAP